MARGRVHSPLMQEPFAPIPRALAELDKMVSANYEELWQNERAALTGCADMKRLLAERLIAHYAPARERYNELLALPHEVDNILGDGAARLSPIVTETMREVKEKVGLA